LTAGGFVSAGLVSVPCEHSFTSNVGTGRPTPDDLKGLAALGAQIADKLLAGAVEAVEVPGNRPYVEFPHADSRPVFDADACINCLACVAVCPAGAIDADDVSATAEWCIGCYACVKACPEEARMMNLDAIGPVIGMLEGNFAGKQEAALVL
jgi:NAD-dependent dihydropyrimidine dehydrogenase PreA subunit